MPSILSVSYDQALLITRKGVLETAGHSVTSACGLAEAVEACSNGTRFDLLVVGHSIPRSDKETLIKVFRANNSAPVLALKRPGDEAVFGAHVVIEPDHPQVLLNAVAALMTPKRLPSERIQTRAQSQAG